MFIVGERGVANFEMAATAIEPTKVEEITEGSKFFKVRFDYDDRTVYEIQNRSDVKADVVIKFTQCENIRVEIGQFALQPVPKELRFTLDVPAGQSRTLAVLYTQDEALPWAFDYDLTATASSDPDWLE